ncbi:hypothetical protein SLA2020_269290 [Shorea laevis]
MIESRISLTLTRSLPALRDSFKVLAESTRLVALVVDLLVRWPSMWLTNSVFLPTFFTLQLRWLCRWSFTYQSLIKHTLVSTETCLNRSNYPVVCRSTGAICRTRFKIERMRPIKGLYKEAKQYSLAAGIIINSFLDLEPGSFKALMEEKEGRPPVYPVGPLVQSGSDHGFTVRFRVFEVVG